MTGVVKLTDSQRLSAKLLTARDVAREYGIACRTQADLRERGEFAPVTRIGRRLYVRRQLLEAWLDAHTDPQPTDVDLPQPPEAARSP